MFPSLAIVTTLLIMGPVAEASQGTVIEDHSGNAISGAEIRLTKIGTRNALAELESDSGGHFDLPELAPGEYALDVSHANYTSARLGLSVAKESALNKHLLVCLIRHSSVAGQVINREGQSVKDAYVSVISGRDSEFKLTQVDDDGRFRIYDLPPGRYLITVSYGASTRALGSSGTARVLPGLGSGTVFYPDNSHPQTFAFTGGEEITNIDFALAAGPLSNVSGQVQGPLSAGQYWLTLVPTDQPEISIAAAITASDGSFHFEGVPSGAYTLLASGPTHARGTHGGEPGTDPLFAHMAVSVSGQDVEGLSVPMQKGRAVAFLLDAPADCPDTARLMLRPAQGWGSRLDTSITISAATLTTVDNLAPGSYHASIETGDDRCYGRSDLVIREADKKVELAMLPAASIEGRMTGTEAPHDFTVMLLKTSSEGNVNPLRSTLPDADSHFSFERLRPGRYRTWAQSVEGIRTSPIDIEVRSAARSNVTLQAPDSSERK